MPTTDSRDTDSRDTAGRTADRRIADLERLLEVSRRLGATVDLDPLLEAIAAAATQVLDCERATVFLLDRERDELHSRLATGLEASPAAEIRFPVGRGIAGEVARTGAVVNIPDAYADPRFNPEFDKRSGFRTANLLTLPLTGHDGAIVGVLQVLNKRGGSFAPRDEEVAAFLGTQAGVALQRQSLLEEYATKRRFERDLNIARDIQQGLLPKEQPRVAGFDIAGWNRPADLTGGDYYDFVPLADGGLAISIADVTGHGIGPALVVSEARALFRAVVRDATDLAADADRVQALLAQDLPEGRFVTVFCGVLDPARGSVRFVSAGQGPILVYRHADGGMVELPTQGLPLGIVPELPYEPAVEQPLAAGDMLVLLTDGFFEWANPEGEQFGTERVHEVVHRQRGDSAAGLITALHAAVLEFARGTPQGDDLTAVIVKRTATGG